MKVAVQPDDLQLLTKTLQELFLAEVPSGGIFQVKCAINNNELMILIEHPVGLTVDTSTVFQLVEDVIQSLLTDREEQIVQCFLRVLAEKRPYNKRSLYIKQRVEIDNINPYPTPQRNDLDEPKDNSKGNQLIFPSFSEPIPAASIDENDSPFTPGVSTSSKRDENDSPFTPGVFASSKSDENDSPFTPSVSTSSNSDENDSPFAPAVSTNSFMDETDSAFTPGVSSNSLNDELEEEPFDPFAGSPDLVINQRPKPIKAILFGVACVGIVLLGSGAYLLTNPCLISQCQAIQNAEQLKRESRRLMHQAKSEKELLTVQQQLEASNLELEQIPDWSINHQQIEELQTSLSASGEKIDQVVKALQTGSLAMRKSKTPTTNLEELQARQKLWRRAIAPLEAIAANSDLYNLAQSQLIIYRAGLNSLNQQLLVAERWLKKLEAAKAVANAAAQQETTIKSLKDLQKLQSTWQVAVNALNIIPRTSSAYPEAQQLLTEYKPKLAAATNRATKELLASKTYQQAISAANQAKTFEQKQQWQAAVAQWELAVQSAKQIPENSFQYRQAQSLIEPYSAILQKAQAQLEIANKLQQTRTDLNKVCTEGMRICTFTINNQEINVQLTREYDQARQSNSPPNQSGKPNIITNGNKHLQILQQALSVISDNANLSLAIYDSQKRPVYKRSLEG